MPTSKQSGKPPARRTAKRPVKALPSDKPFIRFYHPASLRAKTLAVLDMVEQAEDRTKHRHALSDIVVELTDSGMEYFFLRPLDVARVGFITKQSAHLGIVGVKRVLGPVIKNIIGRMDEQQLLVICRYVRQLME